MIAKGHLPTIRIGRRKIPANALSAYVARISFVKVVDTTENGEVSI
jgi:hypothetical protein